MGTKQNFNVSISSKKVFRYFQTKLKFTQRGVFIVTGQSHAPMTLFNL